MNLKKIYRKAVEIGIKNDLREKVEIKRFLADEKEIFKNIKEEDLEYDSEISARSIQVTADSVLWRPVIRQSLCTWTRHCRRAEQRGQQSY